MNSSKWFTVGKEEEVFGKGKYQQFLDGDIGNYDGGFNAREQFEKYLENQQVIKAANEALELAEIEVKKALETVNVWGIKIRPLYVYGKSICSISDGDVYIWDGIGESWVDCYNSADFVKQNYIKVL